MTLHIATRQDPSPSSLGSESQEDPMAPPFCGHDLCRDECAAFEPDYDEEAREQPPMKSALKTRNYAFDYYGNPVPQQMQPRPTPQRMQQAPPRYSEFLEEPPKTATRHSDDYYDDEVEAGCIADFAQFLKISFCGCAADENLADDAAAHLKTPRGLPPNNAAELRSLEQQAVQEKTAQALLEFELRAELAAIRRQTAEMEEAYRREIAKEVSAKVILQAQLQARLIGTMEERMKAEIELEGLGAKQKVMALPAPGDSTEGALVVVEPTSKPESSTILTCTPKTSSPVKGIASQTTPFGMSIVVESHHSHDQSADAGSHGVFSPTATRTPTKAASPVAIE